MKARIKSNGKIVEVISRFMPRKRNAASRDWVCNLSDDTCIDESQLEYIEESIEGLDEVAEEYANKHYSEWDESWDDYNGHNVEPENDKLQLMDPFIAGAKWQKEQDEKDLSEKIAAAYQLGLADKEKQMLNEAVEGIVTESYGYEKNEDGEWGQVVSPVIRINVEKYSPGDKVCLIIVKED